jgi:thiamine biosynthesis protein ThiS
MTIIFNGEPQELAAPTSVAELLRQLNVAPTRVAVEVNLELVPRAKLEEYTLREGDRLEVVTLAGGG